MEISLPAILGHLVKTERGARGFSQKELAETAGIHPVALSKIERGVQGDLGIFTLHRLAAALSLRGQRLSGGDLMKNAENLYLKLLEKQQQGELPQSSEGNGASAAATAGVIIGGAAAAGLIAWLATRDD